MRDNDELWELVEKTLDSCCNRLWDKLTPEERKIVFRGVNGKTSMIEEWIEASF